MTLMEQVLGLTLFYKLNFIIAHAMNEAIELYIESVRKISPNVGATELKSFADRCVVKEFDKRELFLESGKVQKAMGFITKGLTRSYFIDPHENEITIGFYAEGDYAKHYPAFIARQPSRYSIQCMERTQMICLTLDDIQMMYQKFPCVEKYGRLIAEMILKNQQARIESFVFQTAEERYVDFVKQHPTLFNRISLSHLCSYLGIERQTLTRIRQKLTHK